MNSSHTYDYLLTGATGQVGRYLLRALMRIGTVAVIMRRSTEQAAMDELAHLAGPDLTGVHVTLGDINTCALPKARHVVNAAGCTKLVGPAQIYWDSNLMPAIRLARHAKETDAAFHQLSSISVGEFRRNVLAEVSDPIPDERQLLYSASKVMLELAVRAITPYAQIFRFGDAVPPVEKFGLDWRSSHWLSILFACGKKGFAFAPDNYSVWVASTEEIADAMVFLIGNGARSRYHLLGNHYSWAFFRQHACEEGHLSRLMSKWMTSIVMYGPEAHMVSGSHTDAELKRLGFTWPKLSPDYWRIFAARSLVRKNDGPVDLPTFDRLA